MKEQKPTVSPTLHLSEATLRAVFDSRTYNIILIGKDGRILGFNEGAAQAAREVQGVEYYVGMDFFSKVDEQSRAFVQARHDKVMAGESLRFEMPYPGVDGVEHWYDIQYDPLKDEAGEVTGVCLTNICIDDRKRAEKALQSSEQDLRAVFNSGTQMMALMDKTGILRDFNRNAVSLIRGLLGTEFVAGRSFVDQIPEIFRETFLANFQKALQGQMVSSERQVTAKDGSEHWFEFTYNPVFDSEKTVTGVCLTGVLIDERKKAEEAMRRSEAHLRAVFNSGSQVTVLIAKDGRIRDFNKTAAAMAPRVLGKSLVPGMPFLKTLPPGASQEIFLKSFQAALEGKETRGERSIQALDGSERWVEVNYQPVFNDSGGVEGVCFSLTFIDERKKAEAAVKESEARYRKLVEFSPDAVLVHDGAKILFANSAAAKLLGASRVDDLVGVDVWRFVKEEFKLIAVDRVRRILEEKGTSAAMEQEWKRLDGTLVPVEVQGTFLPYGGNPAILAILRDITDRRKTAQLLTRYERLATIGKVIAAIAHEVRNPLTVVSGMSKVLKSKMSHRQEYSQELDTIVQQTHRLKLFMNDILDYSRGMEIQKVKVDARSLVEQSLVLANAQYGPRHAEIQVDWAFPKNCPELSVDPGRMEQVFCNLILNAFQSMGDQGTLVLSAKAQGPKVLLEVADDGPGIAPSDAPKLFEPFFTTKRQGSGLGLPISRKIVEAHGGKLEWRTNEPKGCVFYIELPLL